MSVPTWRISNTNCPSMTLIFFAINSLNFSRLSLYVLPQFIALLLHANGKISKGGGEGRKDAERELDLFGLALS